MTKRKFGEGFDYIEHCKQAVGSIDLAELQSLEVGQMVGKPNHLTGDDTFVYAIGSLSIFEGTLPVAIKSGGISRYRLQNEIVEFAVLADWAPELVPKIPRFIGGIAIDGSNSSVVMLTEDASAGSKFDVRRTRLSFESQIVLGRSFAELGSIYDNFHFEGLLSHTAFDVNGQERILDLTPSIFSHNFKMAVGAKYELDVRESAMDAEKELIILIDHDSVLAQSAIQAGIFEE
jgi:hypothetical protein